MFTTAITGHWMEKTNSIKKTELKQTTKDWIEAGKLLAKDTNISIPCPNCKKGTLLIKDENADRKNDRYK